LANDDVGQYLNGHFASSFQKVGTFTVAGNQKQGGNVASYFATPDGRVLHVIAGPVDAATFLREARWVVETEKLAQLESKGDAAKFKAFFRKAHADRLRQEYGLTIDLGSLPAKASSAAALTSLFDKGATARNLANQGRVHLLLTAAPLVKIEQIYKAVFQNILGEKVSTNPVDQKG
jgi:hypothetical protein